MSLSLFVVFFTELITPFHTVAILPTAITWEKVIAIYEKCLLVTGLN